MLSTIFTLSFSLFLLMDSVGNVPLFTSLLKDYNPRKQRRIILREMFIALIIMILFTFGGEGFLKFLGVSTSTTMVAGGIILFLIAIRMIFPSSREESSQFAHRKEPFIVPLAVPLVAGPAVLTAVMLYSHEYDFIITIPAILIAWFVSTVILFASSLLTHLLGTRGISACERLMGLILTLLAVEMFMKGLTLYQNVPQP
jgi:MarC family membrane protein